jgi:hypothetical protein
MDATDRIEDRLISALQQPMSARQRAELERRVWSKVDHVAAAPGRRRRLGRVALVLAVVLIGGPTMFAVSAGLRTTEDPLGPTTADEFAREIDAAKANVPLPPGASWPAYLAVTDHSASYSRGGGRTWVEFVSFCLWTGSWLDARTANDVVAGNAAAQAIADFKTWEGYKGLFATQSFRDGIDRVIDATAAGDPRPVADFRALNCGTDDLLTGRTIRDATLEIEASTSLPPGASFAPLGLPETGNFPRLQIEELIQGQAICAWNRASTAQPPAVTRAGASAAMRAILAHPTAGMYGWSDELLALVSRLDDPATRIAAAADLRETLGCK